MLHRFPLFPLSEPQAALLRHRGPSFLHCHESKQRHTRPLHPPRISLLHPNLAYLRVGIETMEEPFFAQLIEDLADRQVLQVFGLEMPHFNAVWEAWSAPTRAALSRLFQSPSLQTIRLRKVCGYTFPVDILGSATGLRHLEFVGDHNSSCDHPTVAPPMILPLPSASFQDIYLESLEMTLQTNASALVEYLSRPNCPLIAARVTYQ